MKLHCSTVTLIFRVEIVEICSVSVPINMMPLKLMICILVIDTLIILILYIVLFSFLWAAWKAEETVRTEVNIQGFYENPESQCPVDKPKGGGTFYICMLN